MMSFGYNSATVFSQSITSIERSGDILLGQLYNSRKTKGTQSVPIILIAHSLGVLIVKKVSLKSPVAP
jgi:hypothetical protein